MADSLQMLSDHEIEMTAILIRTKLDISRYICKHVVVLSILFIVFNKVTVKIRKRKKYNKYCLIEDG